MTDAWIKSFADRGVIIPQPDQVFIHKDVKPEKIAASVLLHPGCRIEGVATSIGPGSIIGAEGPAVVRDCQIGRGVSLGSGYFDSSVFLDGSSMGGGAHVRPGCLLEEQSGGAHTVGLKQTVLMSYVTLGSLVNFCDCLMSGGTSRKNHSEVGSSYIHFNFTPHQDKATPSLIGDVVRGVMLDQPPIFLGGQGGLVGPARIAFGSVIPAGQVVRHDVLESGKLVIENLPATVTRHYDQACYGKIDRIVRNNLNYVGNIKALLAWYRNVRRSFTGTDSFSAACHQGALTVLLSIQKERVKRLGELAEKIKESVELLTAKGDPRSAEALRQQKLFLTKWNEIQSVLESELSSSPTHSGFTLLQEQLKKCKPETNYLEWIRNLDVPAKNGASAWLQQLVDQSVSLWNV